MILILRRSSHNKPHRVDGLFLRRRTAFQNFPAAIIWAIMMQETPWFASLPTGQFAHPACRRCRSGAFSTFLHFPTNRAGPRRNRAVSGQVFAAVRRTLFAVYLTKSATISSLEHRPRSIIALNFRSVRNNGWFVVKLVDLAEKSIRQRRCPARSLERFEGGNPSKASAQARSSTELSDLTTRITRATSTYSF